MKPRKPSGRPPVRPPRRPQAAEEAAPAPRRERAAGLPWWLAAAALALPPLLVDPLATDPFRLPQRLAAECLALASLLTLAPALARLGWRRALRSAPAIAVLPLVFVAVCGLAVTAHPARVLDTLADLLIGAGALAGWSLGLARDALRRLLDVTLLPAAALSVLAILQLHHLWSPVLFASVQSSERLGVTAFAGNPGDLAAFLVLPCLIAQAGLPSAGRTRWWRGGVLVLCLYALAGTQTVTAFAALGLASVVLWAARMPRRRLLLGAAAALLGLGLLLAVVAPLRQRALQIRRVAASGNIEDLLSGRLDGWRVAAAILRAHPLAGVGFGAYRAEFAATKLQLLAGGVPFYLGHVNPSFVNAHDEYLEVGADLGWPGLLALAVGALVIGRSLWRAAATPTPADRALAIAAMVALALLALAYFPFRLAPVAFTAIAMFAWILGPEEGEPERRRRAPWLAAALALALLAQVVRTRDRLAAGTLAHAVQQQMAIAAAAPPVPAPLVRDAEAILVRAHRLDPSAVEPLAFRGDVLLLGRRLDEAEASYAAAAQLELHPEVLFNWGLALWQQGRVDEAVVQLRRAVALAPRLRFHVPAGAAPLVAAAPIVPMPRR